MTHEEALECSRRLSEILERTAMYRRAVDAGGYVDEAVIAKLADDLLIEMRLVLGHFERLP